ncbi:unnamed protein product [Haemonchus placei]|uniref:Pentatricopeptide repeat-containing protein n=1 Tax=Haemonchus placei TaxID=6290 RepID=A0A0N4WG72_HAEPC|nr:unnamed protein product [Haemonchus placei]
MAAEGPKKTTDNVKVRFSTLLINGALQYRTLAIIVVACESYN